MSNYVDQGLEAIYIKHQISTEWSMSKYHHHDQYELNLSISGGHRFFINDKVYEAEPGDMFIFGVNDLHKNIVPKGLKYERYLIFLKPSSIVSLGTSFVPILNIFEDKEHPKHIRLNKQQLIEIRALLDQTIYHYSSTFKGDQNYITIKLAEILMTIGKYLSTNTPVSSYDASIGFQK